MCYTRGQTRPLGQIPPSWSLHFLWREVLPAVWLQFSCYCSPFPPQAESSGFSRATIISIDLISRIRELSYSSIFRPYLCRIDSQPKWELPSNKERPDSWSCASSLGLVTLRVGALPSPLNQWLPESRSGTSPLDWGFPEDRRCASCLRLGLPSILSSVQSAEAG